MTMIKTYNPFLPAWFDEFRPSFPSSDARIPAVNVHEDKDKFTLEFAAPGLKKENFQIEMQHGSLIVSSKTEEKKEESDKEGKYTRREFSYHSFRRVFRMPEKQIDADKISARYSDGILFITVPKKEEVKQTASRSISIE